MGLDDELRVGRERLQEIRDEVGFDPEGDEPDYDKLNEYVDALEAAVVGQAAAASLIARTMRESV